MYNQDATISLESITIPQVHRTDNSSAEPLRRLLYVGVNGKEICGHMVDLNYIGLSFDEGHKAFNWLITRLDAGLELPDALICDAQITGEDVCTFFDMLSNHPVLRAIPFIMLSSSATAEQKKKAAQMGVDDYYAGVVSPEDIHYRIKFLSEFKKTKSELKLEATTKQRSTPRELLQSITLKHYAPKVRIPVGKRIFDICASGTALLLLSPVLILIAAMIRLESKGPVFYISKRAGSGYNIFDFYKFRSMRVGADKELKAMQHLNQYDTEGKAAFVKISNDPRVTRLGNFIRNSSLDELPQLFNVLKGDMSIVGNRPLPLYEAEQLTKDDWARRFLAPAGITGLWQVTKRGRKEMSEIERMELDIAYANEYSFLFDLKIILKTFPALLQKEAV